MDPDDTLACELVMQAERLGWETVLSFRALHLPAWRAELLLARIDWLVQYRNGQRQQHQTQRESVFDVEAS